MEDLEKIISSGTEESNEMKKLDKYLLKLSGWMTWKKYLVILTIVIVSMGILGSVLTEKSQEKLRAVIRAEVKAAIAEEFEKRDAN